MWQFRMPRFFLAKQQKIIAIANIKWNKMLFTDFLNNNAKNIKTLILTKNTTNNYIYLT